jgi:hypothetical protein
MGELDGVSSRLVRDDYNVSTIATSTLLKTAMPIGVLGTLGLLQPPPSWAKRAVQLRHDNVVLRISGNGSQSLVVSRKCAESAATHALYTTAIHIVQFLEEIPTTTWFRSENPTQFMVALLCTPHAVVRILRIARQTARAVTVTYV